MADLKTVGIKELKNNLSAYLREVRRGVRILVSDRNTVVAELHEPRATYSVAGTGDPTLAEWIEGGEIAPPEHPKDEIRPTPVRSKAGTAARLIDDDRGERG